QALDPYLILSLPMRGRGPVGTADVQFPSYRQADPPSVLLPDGSVERSGAVVAHSPYGPAYRLARRLAARSSSPYDYVRRVRNYLAVTNGFRYVENVPRARLPLERFLFADRRGYCQYFSGAMALLLRMGGIPARVAAGFTPGGRDALRHEWVVRDFDAHAWVEAWFPGIGWTKFDPTPTAAPALLGSGAGRTIARVGERVTKHQRQPKRLAALPTPHRGGGVPAWLLVVGGLLLAGLAAGSAVLVRRREPVEGDVAELRRALRRCGRSPAPELTLSELERRLRGAPDAAAYVRALREAHYGYGVRASAAQRRALRHELGRGLGLLGRVRALWALPPRRA
ncbi:MAG TPA: transglutaminase-like domain-containing protein, partial [Solirubrobacteraceae bacterium]